MKNHQENKNQRLKKSKTKITSQENNPVKMLKNQDLDQEDKTEGLNHKEKKEKMIKISQEETPEEEEIPVEVEVVKEKCLENKELELMMNVQFMLVLISLNIF